MQILLVIGASVQTLPLSLMTTAKELSRDEPFGVEIANMVCALDSTTIDLCLAIRVPNVGWIYTTMVFSSSMLLKNKKTSSSQSANPEVQFIYNRSHFPRIRLASGH
jgi:hypothetical protein